MQVQSVEANDRIVAGLPFVEALARRLAASMPHSIDVGDLVQDGVLGLMDAANRFEVERGIKFETFAERRVRGAMIDALRREAWPRGVRRQRRELEAAREQLRKELGFEPSLAELAARVGSDEKRLGRTIVRINTIESTSPISAGEHVSETCLPAVLVPSEPESPEANYNKVETRERVRRAISSLPPRERRLITLYYFGEVTMKEIGRELGVNESRVSQLHARAIGRLRKAVEAEMAAPTPVRRAARAEAALALDAPVPQPEAPSRKVAAMTFSKAPAPSVEPLAARVALHRSPINGHATAAAHAAAKTNGTAATVKSAAKPAAPVSAAAKSAAAKPAATKPAAAKSAATKSAAAKQAAVKRAAAAKPAAARMKPAASAARTAAAATKAAAAAKASAAAAKRPAAETPAPDLLSLLRLSMLHFQKKPEAARMNLDFDVYDETSRATRTRSARRKGLASQRQPVSSRKRSASVPATSPVTKMTRFASGEFVATSAP